MTGLVLTLLTTVTPAMAGERTEAELQWLRNHSFPLTTVTAGQGSDDLELFGAAVGDATIVGLGEGTHGTREFFQLKHRLLEYLAVELQFSLFAMEANLPDAELVTGYVLDGEGDPRELVAGLGFWTWNTEAILALVEDMRRWNDNGDAYMQFTGCDMQVPDRAMEWVLGFLREQDRALAAEVSGTYREIRAARGAVSVGGGMSAVEAARLADQVVAAFEERRDAFLEAAGEEDTERALHGARLVAQCMHARAGSTERPRDHSMAENVKWLLRRHPGERIAVWAHNFHVARDPGWMGQYLDEEFGDQQLVVGLATGRGTYRAARLDGSGLAALPLQEPPAGSFEHAVAQLEVPILAVDLRAATADDPASRWLTEPVLFRSVGGGESVEQFTPRRLADEFDLVLWIEETQASRPLESGS